MEQGEIGDGRGGGGSFFLLGQRWGRPARGGHSAARARCVRGATGCPRVRPPPAHAPCRPVCAQAAPPVVPDEVSRAEALVALAEEQGALEGEDPRGLGELDAAVAANPRDCAAL